MWRVAISPPPLTECRRAGHQPVAHSVAGVTVCVCVEGGCMCVGVCVGGRGSMHLHVICTRFTANKRVN